METTLLWILSAALIVAGLAGTVLPVLPGTVLVWGGIVLRASDGTMLGALGESGGTAEQDEEIGQLGARVFTGL